MLSVNSNFGASVALQNLTQTNKQLGEVQSRISTGQKVSSARDNGAIYAIAEGQRARVSSIAAVKDGINRAGSSVDVALSAGQAIGKALQELNTLAVSAQAEDLSASQRQSIQANFASLRSQITTIVNSATFNGTNLVNGSTNAYNVLTTDLSAGGTVGTVAGVQSDPLDSLLSGSALLTDALSGGAGTGVDVADTISFSLTGGSAPVYTVQVTANMTINDFVTQVSQASGGDITASYNATTGEFTYATDAAYTGLAIATDDGSGSGFTGAAVGVGGAYSATLSTTGDNAYTVIGFDFTMTTGILSSIATADIGASTTNATAATNAITTAINTLNLNLATLGSQAKALDVQNDFLSKLSDTVEAGIGNLVDADLAKESARLQSLQIKQQLGAQALSIANQAPQVILSLFRG
jgi:flagellin